LRSDAITQGRARGILNGSITGTSVSRTKKAQLQHIIGSEYADPSKGLFGSLDQAQAVLDAARSGQARILDIGDVGTSRRFLVQYDGVTGFHNNRGARSPVVNLPTNVFEIRGSTNPKVFPVNPDKTGF